MANLCCAYYCEMWRVLSVVCVWVRLPEQNFSASAAFSKALQSTDGEPKPPFRASWLCWRETVVWVLDPNVGRGWRGFILLLGGRSETSPLPLPTPWTQSPGRSPSFFLFLSGHDTSVSFHFILLFPLRPGIPYWPLWDTCLQRLRVWEDEEATQVSAFLKLVVSLSNCRIR